MSRFFNLTVQIKENIKAPRHWPLWGNSPVIVEFPEQGASNRGMIQFDDVIMFWRVFYRVGTYLALITYYLLPSMRHHSHFSAKRYVYTCMFVSIKPTQLELISRRYDAGLDSQNISDQPNLYTIWWPLVSTSTNHRSHIGSLQDEVENPMWPDKLRPFGRNPYRGYLYFFLHIVAATDNRPDEDSCTKGTLSKQSNLRVSVHSNDVYLRKK